MRGKRTIMIVGLGELGGYVLEFLARAPGVQEIVVASRSEDKGIRKTNLAIVGAIHQGFYPRIRFIKVDLTDVEGTAEILKSVGPDIVFNSACLQSWLAMERLPSDIRGKLWEARFGPWLPMNLTLTHKLMQAIKSADLNVHVVNAPFPDVVNAVLGRVGLAPTVGIGNMDLLIPRTKIVLSEKLRVPMRDIAIFMIGHHSLVASLETGTGLTDIPYFLKILVRDRDVTDEFDLDELLLTVGKLPIPGPRPRNPESASSAVKVILAILNDTEEVTHAPGPRGLLGGYPVRLSARGADVVLPEGLTMEAAVRINEESIRHDGIERVDEDGTVVFVEKSVTTMREMLGYDCRELRVEEAEARANELGSRFRSLTDKYT